MVQGIEVETQGRGQSTAGRGAGCSRVAGGQGVWYKGSWLRAANGVERRWEVAVAWRGTWGRGRLCLAWQGNGIAVWPGAAHYQGHVVRVPNSTQPLNGLQVQHILGCLRNLSFLKKKRFDTKKPY